MERVIGNKYKLGRKIGSGSFGQIYLGISISLSPYRICISNIWSKFLADFSCYGKFLVSASHINNGEIVAVKIVSIELLFSLIDDWIEFNCLYLVWFGFICWVSLANVGGFDVWTC